MNNNKSTIYGPGWSHFSTTNGKFENIANALTLLFILTSNSLLLYGLYKTKQRKGFTNKMFIVMSINDLICGSIVIPIHFTLIYGEIHSEKWSIVETIQASIYVALSFAGSINTMILAVDRFIAVRRPFKYKEVFDNKRKLNIVLGIVLSTSFTIGGGLALIQTIKRRLFKYMAVGGTFLILFNSILLNVLLILYIRRHNKNMRRLSNTRREASYQKRATKIIIIITSVLILTHLPQTGIVVFFMVGNRQRVLALLFHWTRILREVPKLVDDFWHFSFIGQEF